MATQIGPKIGVDGEAEYRRQMNNLIQQTKTLEAEMRELKTEVTDESNAQENAKRQTELLNEQIRVQEERVRLLAEQMQRSAETTGETSTETLRYKEILANAQTVLNDLQRQAQGAAEETEDLGEAEEDAGESAVHMGDLIKANLLSDVIQAGLRALTELLKAVPEALWDATTAAADYADEILTLSTVTGLSTDQLQEFYYMTELLDTSVDTITGSMSRLTRQMASARSGSAGAQDAFDRLGVRVTNADGSLRDSTEVFFEVLTALGQIENASERDALAMEIFGKSARDLNPLIEAGAQGMQDLAQEAHDVGYVLDEETLGQLGALDDSFVRLKNYGTVLQNTFGAAMAPSVERAVDKLIELGQRVDWEHVAEGVGALLEHLTDKLVEFVDNADIDALTEKAIGAVDAILEGGEWLVEHGDDVLRVVKDIGIAFGLWQAGRAIHDAYSGAKKFLGLLGGGGTAAGAGAGTGAGVGAGTGAGVGAGVGAGTGAGAGASTAGLLALPAILLGFAGYGTYDTLHKKHVAVAAALEDAAQQEYESLEDLRAAEQLLHDEYLAAQRAADERSEMETWAALGGIDPEDGYRSAEFDAAAAAAKARWEYVNGLLEQAEEHGFAAVSAINATETAATETAAAVSETIGGLSESANVWASDMMANYADGMTAGANRWLVPAAIGVASYLAGLFHHSEPDFGPLADDSTWFADMMRSYADQISAEKYLVTDAMSGLAADLRDLLPGGGYAGGGVNYGGVNVTIYGAEGQSAEALYEEFSYRLQQDVLYREATYS